MAPRRKPPTPPPTAIPMPPRVRKAARPMTKEEERVREWHAQREVATRSFYWFVVQAWHVLEPEEPFFDNWHIRAICDHLEAVADGRIPKLLVNVPPGTMKSLLTCVLWPAWVWATQPGKRFMYFSYAESLSLRDSVKTRDLICSEWYQERWPLDLKEDQNAKGRFDTQAGGWRLVGSVTGKGIGEHPDFCCLHPESTVLTSSHGRITIKRLVEERIQTDVWSWNHHKKVGEWRPVSNWSKTTGHECVQIATASGSKIVCTRNHPIFVVGRGYVAAASVRAGDKVLREVPVCVPVAKAEQQTEVLHDRMFQREEPADRDRVRTVREALQAVAVRGEENEGQPFLQSTMPREVQQRRTPPSVSRTQVVQLRDVRKDGDAFGWGLRAQDQREVLLCQMPIEESQTPVVEAVRHVRGVHDWSAEIFGASDVLFYSMRVRSASHADQGSGERPMGSRSIVGTVRRGVQDSRTESSVQGREPMTMLRHDEVRTRTDDGRSPRGLRQGEQSTFEPDNALPVLSRKDARWSRIACAMDVDVVVSVKETSQPDFVYNIGVEVNHNYFADGILTHNCADDPHNVLQAESDADRESVKNWFEGVFSVRGEVRDARRVLVMQRLHTQDCSGLALDKGGWTHLCFPMRFESPAPMNDKRPVGPDNPLVPRMPITSIGFQDPRQVDGELLWPAKYTALKVANLEAAMGLYSSAGQLQQRPTPRGGAKFKRGWFEVLSTPPTMTDIVRYWDKSGTRGGTGARTAGVLMGKWTDPGAGLPAMREKFIVLDVVTCREEAAERESIMKQTAATDRARWGHVVTWVEQEPGSGGKESAQGTVGNLAGFTCMMERVTGAKEVRAEPFISQASVGKVKLLEATWNQGFLDELEHFPLGKLKDQVDAGGGAFNKLCSPTGAFSSGDGVETTSGAAETSQPIDADSPFTPGEDLDL